MANNSGNLRTPTTDEAREMGRKGGIASGAERKRRKEIKEYANILLSLSLKDEEIKARFEDMGVDAEDMNNTMAMLVALWRKAASGDVQAFIALRDTVGEKPKETISLEGEEIKGIKIKFVDKSGANKKKEKDPKICGDYTPPTNYKET